MNACRIKRNWDARVEQSIKDSFAIVIGNGDLN